jgi:hypothetical protein
MYFSSGLMEKPHSFLVKDDEGWTTLSLACPMSTTEALSHHIRVDDNAGAAEAEEKDACATPNAESMPRFGFCF